MYQAWYVQGGRFTWNNSDLSAVAIGFSPDWLIQLDQPRSLRNYVPSNPVVIRICTWGQPIVIQSWTWGPHQVVQSPHGNLQNLNIKECAELNTAPMY